MTTSGATNGLNQHEGDTPASNTNTLSGTVLQSAVDTTEVALMRCSMASNFSFGDGVLDTPDPKGSAAFEGGTLPGRQTSTEAPTCQDATMSIAHMSNSTSLQAVSNQERLTDIQGGCGACQGCDVGHDGFSGDLHLMQNSCSNGVALAENGLQQSGVGTDQQNPQRYDQLGVGFPGSGGSLDESCTFFTFVYCLLCFLIFDVFMLCNLYPLSVVWCFLWVSYTFTITQSIYKVVLTRGIQLNIYSRQGMWCQPPKSPCFKVWEIFPTLDLHSLRLHDFQAVLALLGWINCRIGSILFSWEPTYPTLGKGKSSSKVTW